VVAWVLIHGVQQREDVALVEDPFGEPVVGPRRPDGGPDVERREPHPGGEREQRLHDEQAAGARRRRSLERIGVALEVAEIGQPDRLADEGAKGSDITPVGADGVRALAVQPQGDELFFGASGRDRGRRDGVLRGRCNGERSREGVGGMGNPI
jgi:hypothetical protein